MLSVNYIISSSLKEKATKNIIYANYNANSRNANSEKQIELKYTENKYFNTSLSVFKLIYISNISSLNKYSAIE